MSDDCGHIFLIKNYLQFANVNLDLGYETKVSFLWYSCAKKTLYFYSCKYLKKKQTLKHDKNTI